MEIKFTLKYPSPVFFAFHFDLNVLSDSVQSEMPACVHTRVCACRCAFAASDSMVGDTWEGEREKE